MGYQYEDILPYCSQPKIQNKLLLEITVAENEGYYLHDGQ